MSKVNVFTRRKSKENHNHTTQEKLSFHSSSFRINLNSANKKTYKYNWKVRILIYFNFEIFQGRWQPTEIFFSKIIDFLVFQNLLIV
jgi:hypothetical protein